jgi:hypothetical protein
MTLTSRVILLSSLGFYLSGCGASSAPAREPNQLPSEPSASAGPDSTNEAAARPALTAEACEANGGSVVGDIGDGAIHRPEYRCPNGAKPSGSIRAAEGGPMAIEGSVCCPH